MTAAHTDQELRDAIVGAIRAIAPEVAADAIPGDVDLRDELDIDSMDFLQVMVGIHQRLGIDIPEADYPELTTLDGAIAYVRAALARE